LLSSTNTLSRVATNQRQYGLNKVKTNAFRRWSIFAPYRGVQTTRLTGGFDFVYKYAGLHRVLLDRFLSQSAADSFKDWWKNRDKDKK